MPLRCCKPFYSRRYLARADLQNVHGRGTRPIAAATAKVVNLIGKRNGRIIGKPRAVIPYGSVLHSIVLILSGCHNIPCIFIQFGADANSYCPERRGEGRQECDFQNL